MRAHRAWLFATAVAVVAAAAGCSKDSAAATTNGAPGAAGAAAAPASAAPAAAHVEGKNFRLDLLPQGDCKVGDLCVLTLRLEATGDYHVNKEYPYKFKAQEAANVEFQGTDAGGRNVFSKAAGDFTVDGEKIATMKLKFKATAKGPVTVSGSYKMSVCSAQNCQLESAEIGTTVTAK